MRFDAKGMDMSIKTLTTAALIITGSLVAVASSAPMGPPTAYLGAGRWGVGAEYGYGQMDLETSGTVRESTGLLDTSWDQDFKINELKSNMMFGTLAYGVTDTWDIFARLGASDARGTVVLPPASAEAEQRMDDYDGSFGIAWGVGTRATLYQAGPWSLGGLVQFTWFRPGDSDFSIMDPLIVLDEAWVGKAKLNYWQAQAALAAAVQLDTLQLWAGPFVQFTQGDMDFKGTTTVGSTVGTLKWSSSIDDSVEVGAHFGANWRIDDQFSLWGEGQITADSWLVGAGLVIIPEKSFGI